MYEIIAQSLLVKTSFNKKMERFGQRKLVVTAGFVLICFAFLVLGSTCLTLGFPVGLK